MSVVTAAMTRSNPAGFRSFVYRRLQPMPDATLPLSRSPGPSPPRFDESNCASQPTTSPATDCLRTQFLRGARGQSSDLLPTAAATHRELLVLKPTPRISSSSHSDGDHDRSVIGMLQCCWAARTAITDATHGCRKIDRERTPLHCRRKAFHEERDARECAATGGKPDCDCRGRCP